MIIADSIVQKCHADYQVCLGNILPADQQTKVIPDKNRNPAKNIYIAYPFYFRSYFKEAAETDVYQLTLCSNIFFTWIRLFDKAADLRANDPNVLPLWLLNDEFMLRMHRLFPPESVFWNYYSKYKAETLLSGRNENAAPTGRIKGPTLDTAVLTTARYRHAFAKCATAGLMALSNYTEDPFVESQEYFHAGLQILDELEDWRVDLDERHHSYVLTMVERESKLVSASNRLESKENDIVEKYKDFSDIVLNAIHVARNCFERASASCRRLNVPLWHSLIQVHVQQCIEFERYYSDEPQWILAKAKVVRQIHSDDPGGSPLPIEHDETIAGGLRYILIEQKHDYVEMQHRLLLPDMKKAGGDTAVTGTLFQRMIVLENLLELGEISECSEVRQLVQTELSIILNSRCPHSKGGWSYFPAYPWLPPDAASLSQVIKLLVKAGYPKIADAVEEPLDLLIHHNVYDNGLFRTWVLNPGDRSAHEQELRECVDKYWGEYFGKDAEVTMNVLMALSMLKDEKYTAIIARGLEQLLSVQMEEGYWKSTWYPGNYSATYRMAKLLTLADGEYMIEKLRIVDYLMKTQKADGGWGHGQSDPLTTAYAMLTFYCLKEWIPVNSRLIGNATRYLHDQQKPTGAWDAVKFMHMPVNNFPIRSATITTSFVISALTKNYAAETSVRTRGARGNGRKP